MAVCLQSMSETWDRPLQHKDNDFTLVRRRKKDGDDQRNQIPHAVTPLCPMLLFPFPSMFNSRRPKRDSSAPTQDLVSCGSHALCPMRDFP